MVFARVAVMSTLMRMKVNEGCHRLIPTYILPPKKKSCSPYQCRYDGSSRWMRVTVPELLGSGGEVTA